MRGLPYSSSRVCAAIRAPLAGSPGPAASAEWGSLHFWPRCWLFSAWLYMVRQPKLLVVWQWLRLLHAGPKPHVPPAATK